MLISIGFLMMTGKFFSVNHNVFYFMWFFILNNGGHWFVGIYVTSKALLTNLSGKITEGDEDYCTQSSEDNIGWYVTE